MSKTVADLRIDLIKMTELSELSSLKEKRIADRIRVLGFPCCLDKCKPTTDCVCIRKMNCTRHGEYHFGSHD